MQTEQEDEGLLKGHRQADNESIRLPDGLEYVKKEFIFMEKFRNRLVTGT